MTVPLPLPLVRQPVPDLIRDSEFYEFQKEALRVGNYLVFHSFVDGAPASLWRIVAIERRRHDGRILGLEFSGGVDHWCDGVVVAGTPSLTRSGNEGGRGDRILKASYLRLSVQWRLLTSRERGSLPPIGSGDAEAARHPGCPPPSP